ncbi:MAG: nicotinate phosphoribosyltransferase [Pseudomonadota bacterium]
MNPNERTSALFTDLYEITMARAYLEEGRTGLAVFETFFRRLPKNRGYVVAAGLEDVLDFLEDFHFEPDELEWLAGLGAYPRHFLERLGQLRFDGDVWAVPEGTVVFPYEPIVQIIAPIHVAQLLETYVLNQIHFQSVIATKAARMVDAARGRALVEFGARRAHGTDAAIKAVRASYLAGFDGTSNVLAARHYGIPPFGTMAHCYVQAHGSEARAFEIFARLFPGTTLLVDTYDTLRAVDEVVALARRMGPDFQVGAIRLDSGDLGALAREARARLDAAGLGQVKIFASSNLDEWELAALVGAGAPIDAFGVGTRLVISTDAPTLDMAYKLVEYEGVGRTKLSAGKPIYPGGKQVFRRVEGGRFVEDVIARHSEWFPGEPLLVQVMAGGKRLLREGLPQARRRAREQVAALPPEVRALDPTAEYPVRFSKRLQQDLEALRQARA